MFQRTSHRNASRAFMLGAAALAAGVGGHPALADPNAAEPGADVQLIASGGLLDPSGNGGFYLGGIEVDPETLGVHVLAHDTPPEGVSSEAIILEVGSGGTVSISVGPVDLEQLTRGNDLTRSGDRLYVAGIIDDVGGIYGFEPNSSSLFPFAFGVGMPQWSTSGLTFNDDGTTARVTSNAGIGHHIIDFADSASMPVVDEGQAPNGYNGTASDHVVTEDGRVLVIGDSSDTIWDITGGTGNVVPFFDLTTIPGFETSSSTRGTRGTIDPVSGDIFVSHAIGGTKIYRIKADASRGLVFADGFAPGVRDIDFPPVEPGTPARLYATELTDDTQGPAQGAVWSFNVPQDSPDCIPWDNGEPDFRHAVNSQSLDSYDARVADDFMIPHGAVYKFDTVTLTMAVHLDDPGAEPTAVLEIYDDCNGKPGDLFPEAPIPAESFERLGPAPWDGFELVRFTFPAMALAEGYQRVWLSPVGVGLGLYYWISAGEGDIQGVQGQIKNPGCAAPGFVDGESVPCFEVCTDFNFRIDGACCEHLIDRSDFVLDGKPSIGQPDFATIRAATDFQIPPYREFARICRLEVWMATNCLPEETFGEFYRNECDTPTKDPFAVIGDPTFIEQLPPDQQVGGFPVYRIVWEHPGVELMGGENYWFSPVARAKGAIDDQGVFLFADGHSCPISINEGVALDIFKGPDHFTPVSEHPGFDEPKDFAIRITIEESDGSLINDPPYETTTAVAATFDATPPGPTLTEATLNDAQALEAPPTRRDTAIEPTLPLPALPSFPD